MPNVLAARTDYPGTSVEMDYGLMSIPAVDATLALVNALVDRNLSRGRIALAEGSVGFTALQRLRTALPDVEFVAVLASCGRYAPSRPRTN